MTETITADEVYARLLTEPTVGTSEIRREAQLPTPDARIVAIAAVRDHEAVITAYWPGRFERHVTAEVAYWRFEQAFLNSESDVRGYNVARIAETVRDVAVGLAGALTATEGRLPLGYTSTPCRSCGGSGRQTVTLATGATVPVECADCDGAGELIALDEAAAA